MKDMEGMKKHILDEYERLGKDDTFSFSCHPGISCFNNCCGDVNIVLTPYDILRLKNRLGITSTEFISKYTVRPFTEDQQLPVVLFKMQDDKENKPCHFVSGPGCGVYEDRPWPCRMYPVGEASARTEKDPNAPQFYFIMKEDKCDGLAEAKQWTIGEWMENQGVAPYDAMGELLRDINLHPYFKRGGNLRPQQMEMYFTALYDLDKFRAFIFDSTFLQRYKVEDELLEKLREDDVELLKFGHEWLHTCLFNEKRIPLHEDTLDKHKKRVEEQRVKKD